MSGAPGYVPVGHVPAKYHDSANGPHIDFHDRMADLLDLLNVNLPVLLADLEDVNAGPVPIGLQIVLARDPATGNWIPAINVCTDTVLATLSGVAGTAQTANNNAAAALTAATAATTAANAATAAANSLATQILGLQNQLDALNGQFILD